ncbi:MAG: winged helix-turn-helix domain-containing protein [Rhodanobacter sp.]|nr:winged helix-turn-helix domain-containing protein [Rhodanobacter sp.]
MRILLAEDDALLGDGICSGLRQQGLQVDWVRDGETAWQELRTDAYAAAVLDLGLPRMDGVDVLRKARGAGVEIPILVLTARDAIPDRVRGLDLGADDYVVKPIDLHELGARLRALVRRSRGYPTEQLQACGISLEPASRMVFRDGRPIDLSMREFDLLHTLMINAGRVLSRERLEQSLYDSGQEVWSNVVEVHIHHLRSKLGKDLIRTVRGVGYMLSRDDAQTR